MSRVFRSVVSFGLRLAMRLLKGMLNVEQRIRLRRFLRDILIGVDGSRTTYTLGKTNTSGEHFNQEKPHVATPSTNIEQSGVNELKEEISRISSAMLPNLQKPFVMLEDGVTLENVIRSAFQVPSPQHFMLGNAEFQLPIANSNEGMLSKYIDTRCPRIDKQLRSKLLTPLIKVMEEQNSRLNSEALLKFAPGEDIGKYQFEWYEAHMRKVCMDEQNKVQQWIESSLEDENLYLCSLFLAFNFDMVVVSRLSYILNGYRYSQIGLPSPFVYMMV